MTVYVDSSVLMRIVTGARDALREWGRITRALSSELIRVECLRTIDRARLRLRLPNEDVAERRAALLERLDAFEFIALDRTVLERATLSGMSVALQWVADSGGWTLQDLIDGKVPAWQTRKSLDEDSRRRR